MKDVLNLKDYDLFIVDFDGTIVDTMEMWRHICPSFIRSLGKTPQDDIYLKITSKTIFLNFVLISSFRQELTLLKW